jgi:hypothetical protein
MGFESQEAAESFAEQAELAADRRREEALLGSQPSIQQLQDAWTAAIHAQDIPGARAQTLAELSRLRFERTTWFGERENSLRVSLDLYLQNNGAR